MDIKSTFMWLYLVNKCGDWYPKVILDIEPVDQEEREIFNKNLADEQRARFVIKLIRAGYYSNSNY